MLDSILNKAFMVAVAYVFACATLSLGKAAFSKCDKTYPVDRFVKTNLFCEGK